MALRADYKLQFNTISPENVLEVGVWYTHSSRRYDFSAVGCKATCGVRRRGNGMFTTIGHHARVAQPGASRWVFQDAAGKPLTRDALLARMHDHISMVVGRYKGRIKGWDVVNEALNEDGTLRASPWYNIIGDDYIAKAFQFAHEADPSAELYYNDYNLEVASKRNGAVELVKKLKAAGVTITAVGSQAHDKLWLDSPAKHDSTIAALGAVGVKVNITELDVDVLPAATQNRTADVSLSVQQQAGANRANPYAAGLPDSVQKALAKRYADFFKVFVKHRGTVDRVTFWGVGDGDSWLNNWPVRGRTSYPLLFDRQDLRQARVRCGHERARQARAGGR